MADIQTLNLAGLDLNLLVAFDALMAERNVTRAAERMGLTQSAMSNTLARLRTLAGDPILVRASGGMKPTDRALEMIEPVGAALREIRRALATRDEFDPTRSRQRFRIVTADLLELVLLPHLVRALGREAPGLDLEVSTIGSSFPADELRGGHLDLAVGTFAVPDGFLSRRLLDESFVCIVRRNHPTVQRRLTFRRYTELGHVLVAPFGERGGIVDQALAARDRVRRVAIQTRHFVIAPFLVAQSDFVATVPRRLAERFAKFLPLRLFRPPIRLAGFRHEMVWHGRTAESPAHRWLRDRVATIAAEL